VRIAPTSGHDRVIQPRQNLCRQHQDRPPPVCRQAIARCRGNALEACVQLPHLHEFGKVIGLEIPPIDSLLAMQVECLDRVPVGPLAT
jgi:hypothetical protein